MEPPKKGSLVEAIMKSLNITTEEELEAAWDSMEAMSAESHRTLAAREETNEFEGDAGGHALLAPIRAADNEQSANTGEGASTGPIADSAELAQLYADPALLSHSIRQIKGDMRTIWSRTPGATSKPLPDLNVFGHDGFAQIVSFDARTLYFRVGRYPDYRRGIKELASEVRRMAAAGEALNRFDRLYHCLYQWTEAEDATVIEMKKLNFSDREIARLLSPRTAGSVGNRLSKLCNGKA